MIAIYATLVGFTIFNARMCRLNIFVIIIIIIIIIIITEKCCLHGSENWGRVLRPLYQGIVILCLVSFAVVI